MPNKISDIGENMEIQLTSRSRVWFWQIWGYIQGINDANLKDWYQRMISESEFIPGGETSGRL